MTTEVILYRTQPVAGYYQLTTASINDTNKTISIISGDAHIEWFVNIKLTDADRLRAALAGHRKYQNRNNHSDILIMLKDIFESKTDNPFEEIKEFLKHADIPFKLDRW